MKRTLSIHEKRTLVFSVAIIFYSLSFYLYSQKMNDQNSLYFAFFDLFGLLALDQAATYKNDEKELKIHRLIEDQITGNQVSIYSKLAIIFSLITLAGMYFAYSNYRQLGYVSLENRGWIILLHFVFFLTYSLWIRKEQLEKSEGKKRIEKNG